MIASFFCIYILQGNVVTQFMFGEIFNNYFVANCLRNVTVKNFENWLIFSEDIDNHKVGRFWDTVYIVHSFRASTDVVYGQAAWVK